VDQIPGTTDDGQELDTELDRYPTLEEIFSKILDAVDVTDGPVDRIEVTALASGECTYRVWQARTEEPEQGYFPPPDAS